MAGAGCQPSLPAAPALPRGTSLLRGRGPVPQPPHGDPRVIPQRSPHPRNHPGHCRTWKRHRVPRHCKRRGGKGVFFLGEGKSVGQCPLSLYPFPGMRTPLPVGSQEGLAPVKKSCFSKPPDCSQIPSSCFFPQRGLEKPGWGQGAVLGCSLPCPELRFPPDFIYYSFAFLAHPHPVAGKQIPSPFLGALGGLDRGSRLWEGVWGVFPAGWGPSPALPRDFCSLVFPGSSAVAGGGAAAAPIRKEGELVVIK